MIYIYTDCIPTLTQQDLQMDTSLDSRSTSVADPVSPLLHMPTYTHAPTHTHTRLHTGPALGIGELGGRLG